MAESARKLLPGWQVRPTGWSPNRTCTIRHIAEEVALRLGEALGDVELWADEAAKESGLDLLCYRPFADGRVGVPVYLMQCASGRNWREKLHEPDLRLWTKIVQFASAPKKAFSTPFALSDHDFVRACNLG